jgi:DNA invertase Pin-like site-specific DNA recombinase
VTKRTERLSLDVVQWPARDRAAWAAAQQPVGPLDDGGLAARWSAKTVRQTEKGYGLWLGCLARHGRLDPDAAPGARLTREALTLFGQELVSRVAPQTAASRVRDLSVMIRAFDPSADRSLAKRMQATLTRRASPSRVKRERMIAPATLFAAGLARMDGLERELHRKHDVQNVRYQDGLMMAVLAARGFRRGNLQQMRIDQHITRADGIYICAFSASETKNRRPLTEPLPRALTPYADRYLAEVRPALLRGHVSDAFWISTYRAPLSEQSIYLKICAATEEELGIRLSPHFVQGRSPDRRCDRGSGAHRNGASAARSRRSAHGRAPLHPREGDHRQPALQWCRHAAPRCGDRRFDRAGGYPMRAVIYARYSSETQRECSIEDQLRLAREHIEDRGWTFLHAYHDRAISGASALRPGYQRPLADARAGQFDVVVAEALDRLSRDQEDVAALHKRLSFAGIRIVTLAEGEITELHVGLKGTMNALYLKDLAQKTRRGLRGRVEAGRSGGSNSYGYDCQTACNLDPRSASNFDPPGRLSR